jgi:hypothetical protein
MRSLTTRPTSSAPTSARVAGLIILIAGIWGGLIPFVGPYFHFTLGPDHTWTWTSARFYLDVLPAVAAIVGGLLLLVSGRRVARAIGALCAMAGGIWFAIGPDVSRLWHSGGAQGVAHGPGGRRTLEHLALHSALGVLIVAFAAYALACVLAARRRAGAAEVGAWEDAVDGPASAGTPATAVAPVAPARRRLFGRRRPVAPADEPATVPADAAAEPEPVGAPDRG